MRLRPAVAEDAAALAAILGDWRRETGWLPIVHTPEEDARFLVGQIEGAEVTVAEEDGRPVGYLARDGATIPALFLVPAARGRGVGRALLDRAKARSPRLELWAFQASGPALAFYARQGFREVRRTEGEGNEEGLPDVQLAWGAP